MRRRRVAQCVHCGAPRIDNNRLRTCGTTCIRGIDPRLADYLGVLPWTLDGHLRNGPRPCHDSHGSRSVPYARSPTARAFAISGLGSHGPRHTPHPTRQDAPLRPPLAPSARADVRHLRHHLHLVRTRRRRRSRPHHARIGRPQPTHRPARHAPIPRQQLPVPDLWPQMQPGTRNTARLPDVPTGGRFLGTPDSRRPRFRARAIHGPVDGLTDHLSTRASRATPDSGADSGWYTSPPVGSDSVIAESRVEGPAYVLCCRCQLAPSATRSQTPAQTDIGG